MSAQPLISFEPPINRVERSIDRGQASDLAGIRWLLAMEKMPIRDITVESLEHCLVYRDGLGVIAVVFVERIGEVGLLRSLVVTIPYGGCGIGRQMVQVAEKFASQLGVRSLFVVTDSATGFFEQLNFHHADCDLAPPEIQARLRAESSPSFLMVKP